MFIKLINRLWKYEDVKIIIYFYINKYQETNPIEKAKEEPIIAKDESQKEDIKNDKIDEVWNNWKFLFQIYIYI